MALPISGHTRLLFVLGHPIEHARSPVAVNALLAARARDAVLVPLHVRPEGLAAALAGLRRVENLAGGLVTMPHKESVVPLVDEASDEVLAVGACNVIRRESGGRLVGTMLDGEGFVAGLRSRGHEPAGKRAFLAGAGGAASGIAFALARHGVASLSIHNRTRARAEALAARLRAAWPALEVAVAGPRPEGAELVINGTSLGLRAGDALPLDVSGLEPGALAAEVVIQPETTEFLRAAAARGCAVHPGEPMLAQQLELFLEFVGL